MTGWPKLSEQHATAAAHALEGLHAAVNEADFDRARMLLGLLERIATGTQPDREPRTVQS